MSIFAISNRFTPPPVPASLSSDVSLWLSLLVIVHIWMAVKVWQHAVRQQETVLFGLWLWSLLTLVMGLAAALFYWAAHCSTLRPPPPAETPEA